MASNFNLEVAEFGVEENNMMSSIILRQCVGDECVGCPDT